MDNTDVRGVWTRGQHPRELVLSDGSRLALETDSRRDGQLGWRRSDGRDPTSSSVSVAEAAELAGEAYADYVTVRTRAESEWLRAVADWPSGEARRLDGELASALA